MLAIWLRKHACCTCLVILGMSVLFLIPSFYNGFPFVSSDTSSYVTEAINRQILPMPRSIYYSIFITILDLRLSAWPSVIGQSLISAWVIWRFASTLFYITSPVKLFSLGILLTLGSSLPWFLGQIMPDVFTALMILALGLLCLAMESLPRSSAIMLVVLIIVAIGFHQANLLVALWTLPALGLCAAFGWRLTGSFRVGLSLSGIALALGAAALFTANLVAGRITLSSGGTVIYMARLLDDGTGLSYLEHACPQQRFSVCGFLDELKSYKLDHPQKNALFNFFLWQPKGPLDKLGGFGKEQSEAGIIVANTLRDYPLDVFSAAVSNGWRQMLSFHIGDSHGVYRETEYPSPDIKYVFGPVIYNRYLRSKQISGLLEPNFDSINRVHGAVLSASLAVLIGFVTLRVLRGFSEQSRALYATVFVSVLGVGNAFTMGALSGPFDRFQSRVVWLLPLLAICVVLGTFPVRWPRNW